MELKLYDTLTREKRAFQPLDPARVRMYVCGPTVYDFAHIGNARPVIVFDVLFRLLRHLYGAEHVTYVRNITDVDDKINARAAEEHPRLPLNEAIRIVTEKTERQFHEDVNALGCLRPTVEPRATEHIEEMKALIERLVAGGHAYVAEGHVLFSVPSMPDYGKLSKRSLDEMEAGARVEVAPYKQDPMDFVLWKPSKPGEPAWPSPSGIAAPGRPGWHIECSAMSWKHLGETFDIHGGGIDLVFPHHENEIAQSRCSFHTPVMANFWMHNGFLQVEGEKMSKSLGNFVTIRELRSTRKFGGKQWAGNVVRLTMLKTHYQKPMDWTVRALEDSERQISKWKFAVAGFDEADTRSEPLDEVMQALSNDLNTPYAIQIIDRFSTGMHSMRDRQRFVASLKLLGLFSQFRQQLSSFRAGLTRLLNSLDILKANQRASDTADMSSLGNGEKFKDQLRLAVVKKRFSELIGASESSRFDEFASFIGSNVTAADISRLSTNVERITKLMKRRVVAKAAQDFAESDRIRDELASMGIVILDTKDGVVWDVKR